MAALGARPLRSGSSPIRFLPSIFCLLLPWGPHGELGAQNTNIFLPVDSIELLYAEAAFPLPDSLRGTRSPDDRTRLVVLWFDENTPILTKWAAAERGGDEFNNSPRYEVAAYELQKLFLDEPEYVVPPTVPRMVPLEWYRTVEGDVDQTFDAGASVLVVLQYMVYGLTADGVFDGDRLETDSVYARHWANANLFTHLIRHSDSNRGNLLISTRTANPRVFSVDNGVAFRSDESVRGTRWSRLLVDRFPAVTAERLREISEERLHATLGVLGQWERDPGSGELLRMPPSENLWPGRGIRQQDGVVQIGLTRDEIDDVWDRIQAFLRRVDQGTFRTF